MKKLLLIFSIASISSIFGKPCQETCDPCAKQEPAPASGCDCNVWTPPAMVVPQHSLNVQHTLGCSCSCGCGCSTSLFGSICIKHSEFTPPPITSLFCNCEIPVTPAPTEAPAEPVCVEKPKEERVWLCAPQVSAASDGSYGMPISAFTSAQTINGICRKADGQLLGSLEVKIGKLNKNTNAVKVSGKITLADGKKLTARAVSATVGGDNGFSCNLAFGGVVGSLPISVSGSTSVPLASTSSSTGCTVQSCLLGGELQNGAFDFVFAGRGAFALPAGFGFLLDETSWQEQGTISGGTTFKFAKAQSPKIVATATGYGVAGLDAGGAHGLKIRYSKKTGVLKGTYVLYASNLGNTPAKPKLKKYTMKVSGFVYNGNANGLVTAPDGTSFGEFLLQ